MLEARLSAQLLSGDRPDTPEQAVERLLAVQAQDSRGARLAVRARTEGVTAADVEEGLTQRRSLLISTLNRGTLHLVRSEDYWWLHPLTTPQLAVGSARRLAQEGVTPAQAERGVALLTEHLTVNGPATRRELRALLDQHKIPTANQAFIHVIFAATLEGRIVRGPMRAGEHCFVTVDQWLGPAPPPLDREEALARLARRYLMGHGPADAADLARWANLPLGETRQGFVGIEDEIVRRSDGLFDLADRPPSHPLPAPRLLGSFEPLLLGWANRDFLVGDHLKRVAVGGVFRPFVFVEGRIRGTWALSGGHLRIRLLEPLNPAIVGQLEREAGEVLAYLGLPDKPPVIER